MAAVFLAQASTEHELVFLDFPLQPKNTATASG
jgi:hypothetical protein